MIVCREAGRYAVQSLEGEEESPREAGIVVRLGWTSFAPCRRAELLWGNLSAADLVNKSLNNQLFRLIFAESCGKQRLICGRVK